jgi:hypothetical protein
VIEAVTYWSTSIFQGGWTGQGKGVVASFRLELENQGIGDSFRLHPINRGLDPPSSCS